jgi:hypothetical protein
MKRIILIAVCSLVLFSCKTENKSNDKVANNKEVKQEVAQVVNNELIDEFFTNEYIDSLVKTSNFETVEAFEVSYNGATLKIYLQHILDWNDPGDYLKVKIVDSNENILFEQTNFSGWVKIGNNYSLPETVIAENLIESDKVLLIDNKNGKQLILFGWVYASSPGLMTVIDLFPKPKIIFNTEFELIEISSLNDNGFRNLIGGFSLTKTVTIDMEKMVIK